MFEGTSMPTQWIPILQCSGHQVTCWLIWPILLSVILLLLIYSFEYDNIYQNEMVFQHFEAFQIMWSELFTSLISDFPISSKTSFTKWGQRYHFRKTIPNYNFIRISSKKKQPVICWLFMVRTSITTLHFPRFLS